MVHNRNFSEVLNMPLLFTFASFVLQKEGLTDPVLMMLTDQHQALTAPPNVMLTHHPTDLTALQAAI
jgi:hypothetical protein